MKKKYWAILIVFLILLADQVTKILVKTSMYSGESIPIFGDRVSIYFIENPGMAFGWELGGVWGKITLTVFRLFASGFLIYVIYKLIKLNAPKDAIIGLSIILAGAFGNIIDSAFYGLIFSESSGFNIAEFMPANGGYAPFLQGHVVDMIYCPVFRGTFPDWLPIWGGEPFKFFKPVFNIADSAITIGVIYIIIFPLKYLRKVKWADIKNA